MHRILLIARRDYLAAVRTKAFLFGLIFAPLMFGGGFGVLALTRGRMDAERRVAVLDETGLAAGSIVESAGQRNEKEMFDKLTGRQVVPRYRFEAVPWNGSGADEERLALSDRVRRGELFAFLDVGPDALQAAGDSASRVGYYSNGGGLDDVPRWLNEAVTDGLERARLQKLGVDRGRLDELLGSVRLESMTLIARDPKGGTIRAPRKKDPGSSIAVPYAMTLLLMMIVLLGSATMLPAVAEDKLQRVFEMLLVSASPFELMMGKALAAVGRSLTGSVFYIAGALLALQAMALIGLAPLSLLPWFFVYVVAEVIMISTLAIALGAACGSPQDAHSLNQLLILPVVVPVFFMAPILQQPNSPLANALSLFPPFTPLLMMLRQSMPTGVPAWQPWVGLAGVLACALAATWAASRIFRVAILFQGAAPKLPELFRWALRG